MSRSLTQSEASRLLRGESPQAGGSASGVVGFNASGGTQLTRERESALVGIYSRFGNALQTFLQTRLKTMVDVTVTQSEIVSFAEYQASLANPCACFHFDLGVGAAGLRGVMDLTMRIPMLLVEVEFGGRAERGVEVKRQPLTMIEQQSARRLVDRLCGTLQEAWSQHVLFSTSGVRYEGSPDALEILDRTESVLVTYFDVVGKEGFGGAREVMSVALPTRAIEGFLSDRARTATSTTAMMDMPFGDQLAEHVARTTVTVQAMMPESHLAIGDLAHLREGSIIGLGITATPEGAVPVELLALDSIVSRGGIFGQSDGAGGRPYLHYVVSEAIGEEPLRPTVTPYHAEVLKESL